MKGGLIAKAETSIEAPVERVWDALTNPDIIKEHMFGTSVISDWNEGSKIIWKGEWKGKSYEDYGKIVIIKPCEVLQYTHFSPLSGVPDVPENHHTVTITLKEDDRRHTVVSLMQDNNPTEDSKTHAEGNWMMMLAGLKKAVERHRP